MILPVDVLEVDVLVADVLELDVLGARPNFQIHQSNQKMRQARHRFKFYY
jgi:hypothetical protein